LEKGVGNITEIVSNTIKHAIMRIKPGIAVGPGNIPIELIKNGGQKLFEMITILLNKIINGEKVPEEWKSGRLLLYHRYIRKETRRNVKMIKEYQ